MKHQRFTKAGAVPSNDRGGYAYQRFVDQAENPFNILRIVVKPHGRHGFRRVDAGLRNYYVMQGSGQFTIAGETRLVTPDMLMRITPGQSYSYKGGEDGMTLLEFNVDVGDGIAHTDLE